MTTTETDRIELQAELTEAIGPVATKTARSTSHPTGHN